MLRLVVLKQQKKRVNSPPLLENLLEKFRQYNSQLSYSLHYLVWEFTWKLQFLSVGTVHEYLSNLML